MRHTKIQDLFLSEQIQQKIYVNKTATSQLLHPDFTRDDLSRDQRD